MDRARLVTHDAGDPDYRGYEPIHPRGADWRGRIRKLLGPVIGVAILLGKWFFLLAKASTIFVAVAAYALIWGWRFAVGIVLLILLHETGHYIEAKREGLDPKLPVFVPFLGAYVRYTRGNPWQTARVAIAGPIFGGLASLACYLIAHANGSDLFFALAYFGFFLNLFNLVPFGIFDGGAVWSSARWLRLGGAPGKANVAYFLYFATALALGVGMWAAHVPQHRL